MMLVSVIVPVYNVEKYIERCAVSIFEQSYNNLEIIFVDDCGTDDSMNILANVISRYKETRKNIRIVKQQSNGGLAAARLAGLQAATGVFVSQIDSDDYIDRYFIEKLVDKACQTQPMADIVMCDMNYIYTNEKIIHKPNIPPLDTKQCLCKILEGSVHSSVASKLIKRSLYTDYDIWPVPGLNMWEDKAVVFRHMYYANKIAYIPEGLYYYDKTNDTSLTSLSKMRNTANCSVVQLNLINSFFTNKNIDTGVKQSIRYNEIAVLGFLILYGFNEIINDNCQLFSKYSIKEILRQPVVPIYHKLAVALYQTKATRALASLLSKLYLKASHKNKMVN